MTRWLCILVGLGVSGCTATNPRFDRGAVGNVEEAPPTGGPQTSGSSGMVDPTATRGGTSTTATPTTHTNSTGDLDTGGEESGLVDTGFEDDGPPPVCDPQLCDGQCIEGECVYPRIVFVSSVGFSGDMDGLEGAHELCTELGQDAGWGGSFRAWLSDQNSSPALHMVHGDDPFIRPDGVLVAWDWEDLTDGELEAPISLDEWGDPGPETFICTGREVWSNTDIHGSVATNLDCNGWTNGNVGITSEVGEWDMQDANWAWTENCRSVSCGAVLPVYCFQQ